MSTFSQRSFSGGEIAPSLYARVDTAKYSTGLRTCKNMMVMRHGGAANRPGTTFIGEVKDSASTVRLIPFVFNASQTYCLEFGHLYMRVIRDAEYQNDLTLTITGITIATPAVFTYTGTDPANGDELYITGIVGTVGIYLNNRNFKITNLDAGLNTFQLTYMNGDVVNTTGLGAYTSGGSAYRVYTLVTPYVEQDLSTLKYVQSADVITITHQNYTPRDLARTGHTSWTLTERLFAPEQAAPTSVEASGSDGTVDYWVVTAVAIETFEESLQSSSVASADTLATSAAPRTITWVAAANALEYNIYKKTNGVYGFIGTAIGTSFVDNGISADATDTPPTARTPFANETGASISAITLANPGVITAAAHGFSEGDFIYISGIVGTTQLNGRYFFVVYISSTQFSLLDLSGDEVDTSGYTAWSSGGTTALAHNLPGAVSYVQQRIVFSNTRNDPEKNWCSQTGNYTNFTVSKPLQDDDAVTFSMVGRQVNSIEHVLELGKAIVLTSAGEWTVEGNASGILLPGEVNPKQSSYNGAASLAPVIIGGNALYVQSRGTIIRDLSFDYQVDNYRGSDLTIFSAHLFDGYSLVDMSYQQVPHSIVWCVRNDGTLLGLTYVREQQMVGWHRHEFEGTVENVCCIPEGNEDAVYLTIKRTVDGDVVRYIERMSQRRVDNIVNSVFMDCTHSYDGTNTSATTMTLSGGTTWVYTDVLTLTSSAGYFTAAEVGNAIHLTGSAGDVIRFTITGYTNTTTVTGNAHMTVPVTMRSVAITTWTRAVDQLTGLWNLEGETVSVFADGFVVASPNNASYTAVTVANGTITLDRPYGVIYVGLPYTSDIETLDIDSAQTETISDKKKIVSKLTLFLETTRGVWVGGAPPSDDTTDPLEGLVELKIRNAEGYSEPVDLVTGVVDTNIQPEWNSNGRVFVRQVDPVPMAVLAVAPAGLFPFPGRGG